MEKIKTKFLILTFLVLTLIPFMSASPFGYDNDISSSIYNFNGSSSMIGNVTNPLTSDLDVNTYQIANSGNQYPNSNNVYSNGWFNKAWAYVYAYIVGLPATTGFFTNYNTGFQNVSHIDTVTLNVSKNATIGFPGSGGNLFMWGGTIRNVTSINPKGTTLELGGTINITGDLVVHGNMSIKRPYYNGYENSSQKFRNTANAQVVNLSNNADYDAYQISIVGNQNITFQRTGDYLVYFSPEFYQASGTNKIITFWLQKNGTDIPWSNSRFTISNGEYFAPTIVYQFDIENPATDNIRIMWYSDSIETYIYSSGVLTSPTRPSIPGVLINIQKASEIT